MAGFILYRLTLKLLKSCLKMMLLPIRQLDTMELVSFWSSRRTQITYLFWLIATLAGSFLSLLLNFDSWVMIINTYRVVFDCWVITYYINSLATAGYGTALGVIRAIHEKGVLERAYCTETRPFNQVSVAICQSSFNTIIIACIGLSIVVMQKFHIWIMPGVCWTKFLVLGS